jgi:DNA-directed RNA polymerase subunit H (RpoH/RPB5)
MSQDLIHIFYGARMTCLEMCRDRGYTIPPNMWLLTEEEFRTTYYDPSKGVVTDPAKVSEARSMGKPQYLERGIIDHTKREVKLFYGGIGLKDKEFAQMLKVNLEIDDKTELSVGAFVERSGYHVILLYDERDGTKLDGKYLREWVGQYTFFELFDIRRIFNNPTKHVYQARWRLLKKDEIRTILKQYGSDGKKRFMLGSVCVDDPINTYYGGRPPSLEPEYEGDVYEIIRDGNSIFYRKVVPTRMNLHPKGSQS